MCPLSPFTRFGVFEGDGNVLYLLLVYLQPPVRPDKESRALARSYGDRLMSGPIRPALFLAALYFCISTFNATSISVDDVASHKSHHAVVLCCAFQSVFSMRSYACNKHFTLKCQSADNTFARQWHAHQLSLESQRCQAKAYSGRPRSLFRCLGSD